MIKKQLGLIFNNKVSVQSQQLRFRKYFMTPYDFEFHRHHLEEF